MSVSPTDEAGVRPKTAALYLRLLRNRAFMFMWSGSTISIVGDTFFNLAAVWVIYTQSHSALQTALIQVIWQLDKILFGPLAGVLADRWNRKYLLIVTNLLQALIVGGLAAIFAVHGQASPVVIFAAVFLLNSLYTFSGPAGAAIGPEIVERDLLVTSGGLYSAASGIASIVGSALGGIVVAVMGAAGALTGDAVSFLYATLSVLLARLPAHAISPSSSMEKRTTSLRQEFVEGWRVLADQPVVRAMTWLIVLVNVTSFLGPLWVILINQHLHGDAAAFGLIEAVGTIGGIVGSVFSGPFERRIGAGWPVIAGWFLGGIGTLCVAASNSLLLTGALITIMGLFGGICSPGMGALMTALIPNEYRGRVNGLTRSLNVIAIPISALIGGWLTDRIGVVALFAIGGAWLLGVALLALANRHIRTARL